MNYPLNYVKAIYHHILKKDWKSTNIKKNFKIIVTTILKQIKINPNTNKVILQNNIKI